MPTQVQHYRAQYRKQQERISKLKLKTERDAARAEVGWLRTVIVRMSELQMRIDDIRCTVDHPGSYQTVTLLQEELDELVRDNRGERKEAGA